MSSCERAVASPPWRRGRQVRAPLRHRGHGVVDVVGPVAPPGRASVRGYAGVYTDWRKRPLGAVLGHSCTLLRRCGRPWRCRSVHRLAKTAPRIRFGSFVYTVAMRAASGDTSTPTAMACRQRPSVARLSPGRENRLCASGAAARLAFSLRCQPTQNPEEPAFCAVSFLLLRGFTLLSVRELRKDDRDGTTIGTTGIAGGFLTRINEGHSPKEAPL